MSWMGECGAQIPPPADLPVCTQMSRAAFRRFPLIVLPPALKQRGFKSQETTWLHVWYVPTYTKDITFMNDDHHPITCS